MTSSSSDVYVFVVGRIAFLYPNDVLNRTLCWHDGVNNIVIESRLHPSLKHLPDINYHDKILYVIDINYSGIHKAQVNFSKKCSFYTEKIVQQILLQNFIKFWQIHTHIFTFWFYCCFYRFIRVFHISGTQLTIKKFAIYLLFSVKFITSFPSKYDDLLLTSLWCYQ